MHYDILTSDLIQRAAQLARSLGHSYVGSAHLLLVMAREPGAVGQTLRLLGMDPDLTEAMARLLYGQGTPELLIRDLKDLKALMKKYRIDKPIWITEVGWSTARSSAFYRQVLPAVFRRR